MLKRFTQVRSVCVLVLLYLPLSMMDIAGPCKHSITKDHLLQMKHLINNQLRNGCSITYRFTERQNLSAVCYVKAALPHVLDLLSAHFKYARGSNSALLVLSLQNLILNIYSQHCVPVLNEELEEDPAGFERQFTDSPVQALQRAEEVLALYLQLITHSHTFVDWTCETEYSSYTAVPQLSTQLPTSTEAAQGLLGQIHQSSSDEKFYRLGFTVLSLVNGGVLLIFTVYCIAGRKARCPSSQQHFFKGIRCLTSNKRTPIC
ncbi:macrophage colony-stimulating factor 1b [Salminus brasiliensis]|uniref:macrophage colony-stimulating factor 1b n=1 Tax=Salminus brasiliensis TaxID=930266 RepID=UPI003B833B23